MSPPFPHGPHDQQRLPIGQVDGTVSRRSSGNCSTHAVVAASAVAWVRAKEVRVDFTPYADVFVDHYDSVRGQVRLRLLEEQVAAALGSQSRILDVGGGAGHLAALLASRGHHVTILEPSAKMRDAAADVLRQFDGRVVVEDGSAADLPSRSDAGTWDAVLCHAVAPYVDDFDALVSDVVAASAVGGVVSIVVKNRDALAMRPALERRWADVPGAVNADGDAGGLGVVNRAHTLEQVSDCLQQYGCEVQSWFGVRIFSDHLTYDDPVPVDHVLTAERAVTARDPYRALGRLIHVVARRMK